MSQLGTHLDQLLATLQELERPVARLLRPGLRKVELDASVHNLPIAISEPLRELYEWRDGTASIASHSINEICLFPNFYFPSLQLAAEEFRRLYALSMENPSESSWSPYWFPIFMDVGGCYYAINCESANAGQSNVIEYVPEYGGELVFAGLSQMVRTLIQCYRRGAFFVTREGRLTQDDKKMIVLATELNPEVPAWRRRHNEMGHF